VVNDRIQEFLTLFRRLGEFIHNRLRFMQLKNMEEIGKVSAVEGPGGSDISASCQDL